MKRIFALLISSFNAFAFPIPETHKKIYGDALAYATHMHAGQKRKVTKEPYIVHPIEVSNIVVLYGLPEDSDVVVAGLLHDVPEDTKDKPPYMESSMKTPKKFMISRRFQEIYQMFGRNVAELIYKVTHTSMLKDGEKQGDWLDDNLDYAKQLNTCSEQVILLSAADKLSNLRCMIMELAQKIIENPDNLIQAKAEYWANFGRKKYPDYVVLGKFINLFGLYKLHLQAKYPDLIKDLHQAMLSIWSLHHTTSVEEAKRILEENAAFQEQYQHAE
jgi:(p)ppGpp synthase/HD superfamily hydrolase